MNGSDVYGEGFLATKCKSQSFINLNPCFNIFFFCEYFLLNCIFIVFPSLFFLNKMWIKGSPYFFYSFDILKNL